MILRKVLQVKEPSEVIQVIFDTKCFLILSSSTRIFGFTLLGELILLNSIEF